MIVAIVLAALVLAPAATLAQESRTMAFTLGGAENDLDVTVEYLDPSDVNPLLGGSRVLPIRFGIRNTTSRSVDFNANDVRLNLGGNAQLSPVAPAEAAREIKRMKRVPG